MTAIGPLIELFTSLPPEADNRGLRWVVGNALDVVWDDHRFDDLAAIVRDSSWGEARQMVVLGMRKSRDPRVGEILTGLLGDSTVNGHAALARVRLPTARAPSR